MIEAASRQQRIDVATPRQRMEAVWRERASRLSRRTVLAGAEQNASPVMVLGIGKERFGIHLPDVAEVLPPVRATPVPGAPAAFAGVINVHGEIRAVIDLSRLLGMGKDDGTGPADAPGPDEASDPDDAPGPDLGPPRVILLRKDGREMGLQIDTVEHIRWIAWEDLESTRSAHGGEAMGSQYVTGSSKDRVMLLSTEALFAELHTGVTT